MTSIANKPAEPEINTSHSPKGLFTYQPMNITPPAVFFNSLDGIGNQLFRYACSYATARKNNIPLYFHYPPRIANGSWVRFFKPGERNFILDQFNIPMDGRAVRNYDLRNSHKYNNLLYHMQDWNMLMGQYPKNKILIINDYCHSENFFRPYKDEIISQFTQKLDSKPIENWLRAIQTTEESVSIHFRRGDEKFPTKMTFYEKAISQMSETLKEKNVSYFIFSDDMTLTKAGLNASSVGKIMQNVHWVSDPRKTTSLQEFYLMSRCKHNIIPPSTFSWWAAYLNPNPDKIIIAARYSMVKFDKRTWRSNAFYRFYYRFNYYPPEWIVLDP